MAQLKSWCENSTRSPGDRTCDILKLQPAEPMATAEGRRAHAIKLPPPLDAAKNVYRRGMGSEAYFRALCEAEAGEFIFSRAMDVEGILQMRPRTSAHLLLRHLYALEDPYGHQEWELLAQPILVGPGHYRFLEQPVPGAEGLDHVIRYDGYDGRNPVTMKTHRHTARRSKYGYTWRGISRPNDRELGIAGGEQIVVDLESGAVLAVRRGFVRTGDIPPGLLWSAASPCPGQTRDLFATRDFLVKVLKPAEPGAQTPLAPAAPAAGTAPGERFRAVLAERKSWCESQSRTPGPEGDRVCALLKLKAADPLLTRQGRLAHSIRLPAPLDAPKKIHRPGMRAEDYFRALCDSEAGEFIFSTVADVPGVLKMRPRHQPATNVNFHLHAVEDPYGYLDREHAEIFVGPGQYRFLEQPHTEGLRGSAGTQSYERVARLEGFDGRDPYTMKSERDTARRSRYGFIWRGISRPEDRELGIGGGELIIQDLQTDSVLAVKRGFARTEVDSAHGVHWPSAENCPGDKRHVYRTRDFVNKILKPESAK